MAITTVYGEFTSGNILGGQGAIDGTPSGFSVTKGQFINPLEASDEALPPPRPAEATVALPVAAVAVPTEVSTTPSQEVAA